MSEDEGSILGQPRKEWTLPRRDFEKRIGIPDGWHVVTVYVDVGEVKVVAFPDKTPDGRATPYAVQP